MDIVYNNLVKNYLRIRIWGDSFKYGIVDANNGKEYVQPIFDDIQYHKDVNMIELDFNGYKALWRLEDFEIYANSLQ